MHHAKQIEQTNDQQDGGFLEKTDEIAGDLRQRYGYRLGQDDQRSTTPVIKTEGLCGLVLPYRDTLQGAG